MDFYGHFMKNYWNFFIKKILRDIRAICVGFKGRTIEVFKGNFR